MNSTKKTLPTIFFDEPQLIPWVALPSSGSPLSCA
jgi:hypothetical protein